MQRTLIQNGNFTNGARNRALPINGLQTKYKPITGFTVHPRKRVNYRPVTWHVHYAGVRVGVIVERIGRPRRRRINGNGTSPRTDLKIILVALAVAGALALVGPVPRP